MPKLRDIDPRAKRRNHVDHIDREGVAYVDGTIETVKTRAASQAYREGWERTFGKRPEIKE